MTETMSPVVSHSSQNQTRLEWGTQPSLPVKRTPREKSMESQPLRMTILWMEGKARWLKRPSRFVEQPSDLSLDFLLLSPDRSWHRSTNVRYSKPFPALLHPPARVSYGAA